MIDPHTGAARNRPNRHGDSVGTFHRSALKLMTMSTAKNAKSEKRGYLQATLFLQPHTAGGGRTLCPHSTPACREMCLAGAGLSGLEQRLVRRFGGNAAKPVGTHRSYRGCAFDRPLL